MKKKFRAISWFGSALAIIAIATVFNFENTEAFDTIATFLSITTGFTITALSIIATSSFSKKLYGMEDAGDNSKTLLHRLVQAFKNATLIFITAIGFILAYKFLPKSDCLTLTIRTYSFSLLDFIKATVWFLTIVSFAKFINLFKLFSKFIIRSVDGNN